MYSVTRAKGQCSNLRKLYYLMAFVNDSNIWWTTSRNGVKVLGNLISLKSSSVVNTRNL